jgi:L,D-transpeptidase YcbB
MAPRIFRTMTLRVFKSAAAVCGAVLLMWWMPAVAEVVSDVVTPNWRDFAGQPNALAREALTLLGDADSHGLEPADYGIDALRRDGESTEAAVQQAQDRALTHAMLRYLADLHRGRVDPAQLQMRFRPDQADVFSAEAQLLDAMRAGRLAQAVERAIPASPQYVQLRNALRRYRDLAGHPAWREPLPPLPRSRDGRPGRLDPGGSYVGLPLLSARLRALGDLEPAGSDNGAPGSVVYDDRLVQAVRSFQARHGLTPDGVIGRQTLARLEVDPAQRVTQIALAMERLRWTPLMRARRMIVINVPEFVLRAYEIHDGVVRMQARMRVIVGQAMDHRTPLFDEDMRFVEFSPYWNVPPSIARAETVPRLRREPAYGDRMGFEVVGPTGLASAVLNDQLLDDVLAGRLTLRQRPGPVNALGGVKFVFPNREHIYLHHTPSVNLFGRDQRDFSHGCIRVEQPLELARFVMQGMPGWTPERITEAMSLGESQAVRLQEPVPVVIGYLTAVVREGRVHFFDDLYGHDQALRKALAQRARPSVPR